MTATSDTGRPGRSRAAVSIVPATTPVISREAHAGDATQAASASAAVARTVSPVGTETPNAAGSCCRAMITAMPTVKPSTTGSGTYCM